MGKSHEKKLCKGFLKVYGEFVKQKKKLTLIALDFIL